MKGISGFFEKFNNVAVKELKKREVIVEAIYKTTRQKIQIEDIQIKEGIISIKGDQAFKSEIFLKKQAILNILSKTNLSIRDIK